MLEIAFWEVGLVNSHIQDYREPSCGQFSFSVVSDSLWPHGLQHARPPCPSPTPRACSNWSPSSWWCHPTISSSVIPFSSHLQSFPGSGSFPMSQFFASGGQSIGVSASTSVLPMNTQDWSPLGWTGWISLQSKGPSRVFSSNTVWKAHHFAPIWNQTETRHLRNDQPRQHIKKQRHYFANKGPSSQGYGFSSGHVWMWELDCEESWAPKNWWFWTVVLEKTLESLGLQGDPTSPS